eukprot:gb/GEZN01002908.1/.p1 GENE.gb/GEZN01002908.1/~~gb/GEZN01002908.1/.p1  ORF type:complete len:531 (-),score=100.02 gb/GEZN01002908.1/:210-1802(-)
MEDIASHLPSSLHKQVGACQDGDGLVLAGKKTLDAMILLISKLLREISMDGLNLKKASEAQQTYNALTQDQWLSAFSAPPSQAVLHPEPEPVTVALKQQMAPLHAFLQEQRQIPTEQARRNGVVLELSFTKGTICSDGRLDLCKQVIGCQGVEDLMQSLRQDSARGKDQALVKHLLLGNNIAGDSLGPAIASFIASGQSALTTWYIAGNRLTAKGISPICEVLADDKQVRQLWLKRNPLGADGAKELADLLSVNTYLQVLDLTNTAIKDEGVACILSALALNAEHSALQYLYLDANAVSTKSLPAIVSYFTHVQALQHKLGRPVGLVGLSLGCNRLGDTGAQQIAQVLRDDVRLLRLCLASCGISTQGGLALADMLRTNRTLQHLDLGYLKMTIALKEVHNRIGDQGLSALAEALKVNGVLVSLDVSANAIGQQGFSAMEASLFALDSKNALLLFRAQQFITTQQPIQQLTRESIRLQVKQRVSSLQAASGAVGPQEAIEAVEAIRPKHLVDIESVYRLGKDYSPHVSDF